MRVSLTVALPRTLLSQLKAGKQLETIRQLPKTCHTSACVLNLGIHTAAQSILIFTLGWTIIQALRCCTL